MSRINCNRIIKKCYGVKGFRVSTRRFSVRRLRREVLHLLGILRRLKYMYEDLLRSLRRNLCKKSSGKGKNLGYDNMGYGRSDRYGIRSLAHSKSFCAEAIADCLDFIKKNSIIADETEPVLRSNGWNPFV